MDDEENLNKLVFCIMVVLVIIIYFGLSRL